MKNFIIMLLSALSLCSCSLNYLIADISLSDNEGRVIGRWEDAVVQTSANTTNGEVLIFGGIKDGGGLNFIDKCNVTHYISGGIIHAENIRKMTEADRDREKAKPLMDEYKRLSRIYDNDNEILKSMDKKNELYPIVKERMEKVEKRMDEIATQLYNEYGYYLTNQ